MSRVAHPRPSGRGPLDAKERRTLADYLVSRFLANAPNVHNGAWADVEIVRDLPASASQDDILAAMSNTQGLEGKVRISRWDNVEEYDTVPSAPTLAKAVKEAKA